MMVPLRHLVWLLLSAFAFCIALVALALSRQISSLDYGWINVVFMLCVWVGVISALKRALIDDVGGGVSVDRRRMVAPTTLEYRRR